MLASVTPAAPPPSHVVSPKADADSRPRSPSLFSRILSRVSSSSASDASAEPPAQTSPFAEPPPSQPVSSSDSDQQQQEQEQQQHYSTARHSLPSLSTSKASSPSSGGIVGAPRRLLSRILRRTGPSSGASSETGKATYAYISFAGLDMDEIPIQRLVENCAVAPVLHLDLSENNLRSIAGVEAVAATLDTLILDSNLLSSILPTPSYALRFPRLRTLSLNKNQVADVDALLASVRKACPRLEYLSLLKNPGVPDWFSADSEDYQRHRWYVIHRLPDLRFLDSRPVTSAERSEALRVGSFQRTAKLDPEEFERQRRSTILEGSASGVTASYEHYASYATGSITRRNVSFSGTDILASHTSPTSSSETAGGMGRMPSPLPADLAEVGTAHATFGRSRYVYNGRHSEGNRFIRNGDL